MSAFKISNTLCDEMSGMARKFWWEQTNDKTKMAWLSWEKICTSNKESGLGFQDLKAFNLSLLDK